jgi:glycosyltransferase involved in cell wall biosynthesis
VYLDAVFHTFYENTFDDTAFAKKDLQRIFGEEAGFLERAAWVFFESQWGLQRAKDAYGLAADHYSAAGRGGVVDPPLRDSWSGSKEIVTIAMNFEQKGGDLVFDAYRSVKAQWPELSWTIVGGAPPPEVARAPGITCAGVLDPSRADQRERLGAILSSAFVLMHPTREDTSPLVVTEAAYFGCPSISVNAFAIPELVRNGVTGVLVERDSSPEPLANALRSLLADPARYAAMRRNAREIALATQSWPATGRTICDTIERSLR